MSTLKTYVLVINGITSEQLEHILTIQQKSQDKLRFVPQASTGQLTSPALQSTIQNIGTPPKTTAIYNNVRIEWTDEALVFAHELIGLFLPKGEAKQAEVGH